MTVRVNTAEGCPTGSELAVGDTGGTSGDAFSSIVKSGTGPSLQATTTSPLEGSKSYLLVTGTANDGHVTVFWNESTAVTTGGGLLLSGAISAISGAITIMAIRGAAGPMAELQLASTGVLTVVDVNRSAVIATASGTIPTNGTKFAIRLDVDPGTGTTNGKARMWVWVAGSLTVDTEVTGQNVYRSGGITTRRWGGLDVSATSGYAAIRVDELQTIDGYAAGGVTGTPTANTPAVTVAVPTAAWSGTATVPMFTGSLTAPTPATIVAVPTSAWSGTATVPIFAGSLTANTPPVTVAVPTSAWSGTAAAPGASGALNTTTPPVTTAVPTVAWAGTATVPAFAGTLTTTTPGATVAIPSASWAGTTTVPQFAGSLTGNTPAATVAVPLASWAGTVTAPSGGGSLVADTPGITVSVPNSTWAGTATVPVYSGLVGTNTPVVLVSVPISTWAGTGTQPGALEATLPGVTIPVPSSSWAGIVGAPPDQRDITVTLGSPERHPFTLGTPVHHAFTLGTATRHPLTISNPTT